MCFAGDVEYGENFSKTMERSMFCSTMSSCMIASTMKLVRFLFASTMKQLVSRRDMTCLNRTPLSWQPKNGTIEHKNVPRTACVKLSSDWVAFPLVKAQSVDPPHPPKSGVVWGKLFQNNGKINVLLYHEQLHDSFYHEACEISFRFYHEATCFKARHDLSQSDASVLAAKKWND